MFGKRKNNAEADRRKKLKNLSMLDLTNYTPQALRNIKSISNVAMLLVADGDEAYIEAFSEIELENVAHKISVPYGSNVNIINGSAVLTNQTAKKDALYLVNSITVIYDLDEEMNVSICTNGTVILQKNSKVNLLSTNGEVAVVDFDSSKLKLFDNKVTIDSNFVKEAELGTVLAVDNKIYICDDVTADMLREKEIYFISGNKIICKKELWGYIQNHSHVSNKIEEPEKD